MYKTKKYLDIDDVDRSESNYATSGRYYLVDPKKIEFNEWVKKSLEFDPEVDLTYWEFDRKIEGELANRLAKANNDFKQKKYIITNRRIVHVFDNSSKFHRGIHTRPETIMDFILGIYRPNRVIYFPKTDNSPDAYMIRNNKNDVKSYLNVHDKNIMKIQTSFLNEDYDYIFNISEILTSDTDFEVEKTLTESEDKLLESKYVEVGRWLYTLNPNVIVERVGNGIALEEDQLIHVIKNLESITEEFDCNYYLDDNVLTLGL